MSASAAGAQPVDSVAAGANSPGGVPLASRDGEDRRAGSSYRSILKATSVMGAASVAAVVLGMLRTKCVAVLLGPSGVGLIGLYSQIVAFASAVCGMGIANSGVREVARAFGTGDARRVGRTVVTLRRAAWVTGIGGLLAMVALSVPISRATFSDERHARSIALLGIAVLLGAIAAGQSCVLRGTRRIGDVARVSVLGAVNGTLIGVPCYFAWGLDGIAVSLALSAVAVLGVSAWFARRVPVPRVVLRWRDTPREARALLSLGVSFMAAGLLSTGATYLVQALVARRCGLEGVGIYQAAFSLSGALVGFVLGAMSADYYPRLSAVAADNNKVRLAVNEQAQVAILLALPGLLGIAVFAPVVVRVFFAPSFAAAVPVLRWCAVGMLGRIMSWPLGFVLLAKGRAQLFVLTEAMSSCVQVAAVFVLTAMFGVDGAGMAFVVVYLIYTVVMLMAMRRVAGGSWSNRTATINACAAAVLVAAALNGAANPEPISRWGIGLSVTASACVISGALLLRRAEMRVADLVSKVRARCVRA